MIKKKAAARSRDDLGAAPRALSRALRIFQILANTDRAVSLAELSEQLASPKSSLLNVLRPMVTDGYLVLESGSYRLGPRAFVLASRVLARWSFPKVIQEQLQQLWRTTGETVALAVLDREALRVNFFSVIESRRPVRYALQVGTSAQLYCTAAGKLLLSLSDTAFQEQYLKNTVFKPYTPRTITSGRKLRESLDEIRVRGWATAIGESIVESGAIAAPVTDPSGQVIAAMVVGSPAERLEAALDRLRDALLAAARRASGVLEE